MRYGMQFRIKELTMIISASATNVKQALAAARRIANVPLQGNREKIRSGGEDSCYRITLESDIVVEVTIMLHTVASAQIVEA
jgi:hypothetical protein